MLKQKADPGNHCFLQASPLFILLGIVGESPELFSGMAGLCAWQPKQSLGTAAPWVSQRSAAWALLVQGGHQYHMSSVLHAVSFGVWRGSQTLLYEPSVQ